MVDARRSIPLDNRPLMFSACRVYYCIDNCLWEIEAVLDLDGFGTGNAKNSTNTATGSILHRGGVNFHAEHLNPWLPTAQFGMDIYSVHQHSASGIKRRGKPSGI